MNQETYLQLALRTEKPLPTPLARLRHAALGLFTEGGEIATEIKRIAIYEKTLDDVNKDGKTIRTHIAEEVGDAYWYAAIACSALNLQLPACTLNGTYSFAELDDMALMLGATVGKLAGSVAMQELDYMGALLQALANVLVPITVVIGVPLEQILSDNIAKLRDRYPDAYSNEAAEARADKGGLDARNS